MRLKGRKLFGFGVHATVDVEQFRSGDGESSTWGYYVHDDRQAVVDKSHQDDSTLAHEIGHFVNDQAGVYLSETQMSVYEHLFTICRDPRNKWFIDYLAGRVT